MAQYTTIREDSFSQGIDSRSAENQILEGYVKDLLNADVVERRVRKRVGYQGHAGNLPVRVTSMEYANTANTITFTIDSAISLDATDVDLNSIRSTPLVVYGRSSSITSGGPFTTSADAVKYYSGFTIPTRKILTASSTTETLTIPGAEHGITTTNLFTELVESTSASNRSHELVLPTSTTVDESNYNLVISYQNSTGSNKDAYVYYADKTVTAGSSYVATLSHTGSGSESFSIPAATHGLDNFNIITQIQADLGATRERVLPDSLTIASGTGDVTIVINTTTATTYYAILSTAPISQQASGNASGLSSNTVSITGLTNPWLFTGVYLEQTPGGNLELVVPDSVAYNDDTATATITFTNASSTARNFIIYYDYGVIRSNRLTVSDSTISVDSTDSRPQLTIWGLDHGEIYSASSNTRAGWVTHLDSYRSTGESRLVAGLGGNLYTSRTYSESGSAYNYALLYPNLQTRTSSAKVLAPLFWDTGETPARSRGYITSSNSGSHWVDVSAVEYDSATTWVKYTLSVPSKSIVDSTGAATTLSSVISTTTSLQDWLTVQGTSYSRHNGTFRIRQIQDGSNEILIWVENDEVTSTDWDDTGTGGQAGVFTDQLTWLSNSPYIPGDVVSNAAIEGTCICTTLSSSGTTTVVDGVTELLDISGGIATSGTRTSSVLPLRQELPTATASVTNLVRGDMVSYGDINRLLRVKYINADSDRSVSITESLGTATIALVTGTTAHLSVGQKILLVRAGDYTGTHTISDIPTATTIEIMVEAGTGSASGTLLGATAQVDEELEWSDTNSDSNYFRVERRWIPIEAPDDSYGLTPSTYIRHLDSASYGNQAFLRSVMVMNNLYLTNYADEVLKFDGTNIYRAGIFPWQPGLFITQETGGSAEIVADNPSTTPTAVTDNVFAVPLGDEQKFPVGSRIRHSYTGGSSDYTVLSLFDDQTQGFVKVQRTSTSAISLGVSPTLTLLSVLRYYYRLNAVDSNSNVVASAITGYQDHVIELGSDAAIQHKLIGMPAWDIYDYDRLELEIYRTKTNTAAPFYKVTTLTIDLDNTQGYIQYTDSFTDTDLIELDTVNSALLGAELGTTWQEPLRAKYTTSIGNSLVLANVKDYPQLDIQIVASGAVTNSAYAGKILTFRKDNTDTSNTTNMLDRARYEFVNGTTGDTSNWVIGTNEFSFDTSVATSASPGDWIYLTYTTVATTGRDLTYSGWWQIESVSGATVTVNLTGAATASSYPTKYVIATDPTDIPVLLGTDGNLGMVNGDTFDLFDITRRLSMAICASMRQVDISISGYSTFTPWMVARSGNDVGRAGRLIVRQPRSDEDTLEVQLPSSFSGGGQTFQVFVNDIRRSASDQVSASTRLYPSRLLISYENYPEIFDNPTAVLDSESDSAIDVNSADGQDITGVIPFFGDAAFGAAQQSGVLVVFKSNSIYLVDINEKRAGRNPVQRIETEGLGCTAPYSIASTKGGIVFANESGVYCLRRNQTIDYIGRFLERKYIEEVDLDLLSIMQGHHYGPGRAYKLSVPLDGETANSQVYVYNHTGEAEGRLGAWSRYDNHPATGWAGLGSDAYFSSTSGRVFSIRRVGDETDYRDDSTAITFRLDTRALDFGDGAIRKIVDRIHVKYRGLESNPSSSLSVSVDLSQEYRASTVLGTSHSGSSVNGIGDVAARDITAIAHSLDRRRGTYFQVRIENSAIDETVEVCGMDLRVAGISDKGIREASEN